MDYQKMAEYMNAAVLECFEKTNLLLENNQTTVRLPTFMLPIPHRPRGSGKTEIFPNFCLIYFCDISAV